MKYTILARRTCIVLGTLCLSLGCGRQPIITTPNLSSSVEDHPNQSDPPPKQKALTFDDVPEPVVTYDKPVTLAKAPEPPKKPENITFAVTFTYGQSTRTVPTDRLSEMTPFHGVSCSSMSGRGEGSKAAGVRYEKRTQNVGCANRSLSVSCHYGRPPNQLTNSTVAYVSNKTSPIKVELSCKVEIPAP